MNTVRALLLSLSIPAIGLTAGDASACGVFFLESESPQVSGHRMILSVSPEATTLWDQITYTGSPESFGWVLPIKGTVEVGLSSDALFAVLENATAVLVQSPTVDCPGCGTGGGGSGFNTGTAGGVDVLAQEVVGPYETVQLSAQDPQALAGWLATHGYNVPADVQPLLDDYVAEEFNFLALKLVPGEGIDSMRPVRIRMPGAAPAVPLRMVAAGTGAVTPVILWVFGQGRYEPTNFPSFEITGDEVTWNWSSSTSDYAQIRQQKLDDLDGFGFLIESAQKQWKASIQEPLNQGEALASYADADGTNAEANRDADLAALFGSAPESAFVTRMFGQLSRPALATDLQLGASADQGIVSRVVTASNEVGSRPACPANPCAGGDGQGGGGGTSSGGGCAVADRTDPVGPAALVLGLMAALASVRRRRARS